MNASQYTISIDLLYFKGKLEPKFIQLNFPKLAIDLMGRKSRVSIPKEYQ